MGENTIKILICQLFLAHKSIERAALKAQQQLAVWIRGGQIPRSHSDSEFTSVQLHSPDVYDNSTLQQYIPV